MQKGDVVLLPFPFTDLTGNKYRPVVILSVAKKDVIVAFITTQLRLQKSTDIELIPTLTNGLKRKSAVLLDKIATLEKGLITGKLGRLTKDDILQINKNLIKIFQIRNI